MTQVQIHQKLMIIYHLTQPRITLLHQMIMKMKILLQQNLPIMKNLNIMIPRHPPIIMIPPRPQTIPITNQNMSQANKNLQKLKQLIKVVMVNPMKNHGMEMTNIAISGAIVLKIIRVPTHILHLKGIQKEVLFWQLKTTSLKLTNLSL